MGYPMTFRRVVSRNHLDQEWHAYAGADVDESSHPRLALAYIGWRQAADGFNHRAKLLADDLGRLERDTCDEDGVCKAIARRTGIDPEVIATVLKEFMAI